MKAKATKPVVAILLPTPRDLRHITSPEISERFDFIPIREDLGDFGRFDALAFRRKALKKLRALPRLDGIIADDDYPANLIAAWIAPELKLRFPSLRSVWLCQHKYYSRVLQRRVVPKATPRFFAVPLERDMKREEIPLRFPFFLKPVKSYLSMHAGKVRNYDEFVRAVREARKKVPPFVRAFDAVLERSGLKKEFPIGGRCLIAEELVRGPQVTLELFVERGKVRLVDVVDSVFFPGTTSFQRFDTPSKLSSSLQRRMFKIAERFVGAAGFDHSPANFEFICDPRKEEPQILEVNSRMASQFADMFEAVHGTNSYVLETELAIRRPTGFRRHGGKDKVAASFVFRRFEDARVEAVPSAQELAEVKRRHPRSSVEVLVAAGKNLSDYAIQDSESYRYALLNLSAKDRPQLFRKYRDAKARLQFRFKPRRSIGGR